MSLTGFPGADPLPAAIAAEMLDALIAASPENFAYTAGVALVTQRLIPERLAMTVWSPSRPPVALVERLEAEVTRRRGWISEVRTYAEHRGGPVPALASLLRELGAGRGRIGIEARFLTHQTMTELAGALPEAHFIPCDGIFDRLRGQKSLEELGKLEAAAGFLEEAIARTATMARPGMSEREIGLQMVKDITTRSEARLTGVAATVASGPNAHVTHHGMAERQLDHGDLVRLGCRGIYDGYHGIVMRTGTVGPPRAELRRIYHDLHEIHTGLIGMLRPGVEAAAIYREAERLYDNRGHALPLPHVGHSIGLALQERPKFRPGASDVLVAGMVCVVVNVIASDHGRFYLEDMVAIGDDGARELSHASAAGELLEIGRPRRP